MTYHAGKERHERAPCFPRAPVAECKRCDRRRPGSPVEPVHAVVIDASTAARRVGACLMRMMDTEPARSAA